MKLKELSKEEKIQRVLETAQMEIVNNHEALIKEQIVGNRLERYHALVAFDFVDVGPQVAW